MLRRAIELDPHLAEAYGFLSYALVVITRFNTEPNEHTLQEKRSRSDGKPLKPTIRTQ